MSLSPKRASQVSLLAETHSDSVHHLDDRNWSWAYLRVWSFYVFYIFYNFAAAAFAKKSYIHTYNVQAIVSHSSNTSEITLQKKL